jgi:hypothetical protein
MNFDLLPPLDELRAEAPYQNYLRVRKNVMEMMRLMQGPLGAPSNYWQEELAGFDYMLDAPPLIIRKLREHCYHITGIKSYDYRRHHAHAAAAFAEKLNALKALDGGALFVPESPMLGGFGHDIEARLVNIDTLKFYESLIAMDRAGLLATARSNPEKKQVWLEIGAGWGGFAYCVKTLFPQVTYVVVDLPQTLLFSATYLMSVFPNARSAIYPETSLEGCAAKVRDYDFVFLPHFVFSQVELPLDLAINMVSFQEMTTEQVTGYVKHLAEMGCPRLYSHNRDRSGHNPQLTTVSSIIAENFAKPREIEVLGYTYTSLTPRPPRTKQVSGNILDRIKHRIAGTRPIRKFVRRPADYRHLVAER